MKSFHNLFFMSLISFSAVVAKPTVVQSDIFYEISKGNFSAVRTWLKTKPNFSIKNDKGQTLLGAAVHAGKRSIVQALIKAGAHVNGLDSAQKTALDHAVELEHIAIAIDLAKKQGKVTTSQNWNKFNDLLSIKNSECSSKKSLWAQFAGFFVLGIVLAVISFGCLIAGIFATCSSAVTAGFVGGFVAAGLLIYSVSCPVRAVMREKNYLV